MGVVINFEEAKKLAKHKQKEVKENIELGNLLDVANDPNTLLLQTLYERVEFYEKSLNDGNLLYVPDEVFCVHNGSILKCSVIKVKYYKQALDNKNIIYEVSPYSEEYINTILIKTLDVDVFYTKEEAINSLIAYTTPDKKKDEE